MQRPTLNTQPRRSKPRLHVALPVDFDLLAKGYAVYSVHCVQSGKRYDIGSDRWTQKHGYLCIGCDKHVPWKHEQHTLKFRGKKGG